MDRTKILMFLMLTVLLAAMLPAAGALQQAYQIDLEYNQGELSLERIFVLPANLPDVKERPDDYYRLAVISFSGETLHEQFFEKPQYLMVPPPADGQEAGDLQIIRTNISLLVPYFANAKKIDIFDKNSVKLFTIDVAVFSDVCGDKVCQEHESYESCKRDCPSGGADDFCDGVLDGICDRDCLAGADSDCTTGPTQQNAAGEAPILPAILGIASAGAAIGIVAMLIRKRRHEHILEEQL